MTTPAYLIFLDFDGVLHPADASHDSERFRPEKISLVNKIAAYVDARIVLSTAWRMEGEFEKYNRWFHNRIIGATPVHDLDLTLKHAIGRCWPTCGNRTSSRCPGLRSTTRPPTSLPIARPSSPMAGRA